MFDLETFLQMLFVLMPAGIANTAPVWGSKIKYIDKWKTPMDLGYKYKGRRLLGDHKTYRGLILGLVTGALIGVLQVFLSEISGFWADLKIYFETNASTSINWVGLGAALGLFALIGDAVKSFFKRRLHIASGRPLACNGSD